MEGTKKHVSENEESQEAQKPVYRPPTLICIGRAVELVQGHPAGKTNDGYSGYYYEG